SDRAALARCRWPSWKFGTVSVRSSAAFSVTVMIIAPASRDPRPDVLGGPARIEADARKERRTRDRVRRDERARRDQPSALVHTKRPEALTRAHRQAHRRGCDDARDERMLEADGAPDAAGGDEMERCATVAGLRERVRPSFGDHARDTVSGKPPAEEPCKIDVPLRARRAADDRRVDGDAVSAHGGDLTPASRPGGP